MIGSARLCLATDDRRLVLSILAANLPQDATVWVFGSRATGGARRYSDLDLAIDAGRPVTLDELARLGEAFCESDLPFKVDIVDWQTIGDRFRQLISAERVRLTKPGPPDTVSAVTPEASSY